MPKSVAQLINDLAVKAGIPSDNQELKDILSSADLVKQTVPDSLAGKIETGLLTKDAAKNDPDVVNYFRHTNYGVIDAEVEKFLTEAKFEDAVTNEIKGEKNTIKKVTLLAKKVQELEVKKAAAAGGDKGKLQEEINKLNGQLSEIVNKHKQEKDDLILNHQKEIDQMFLQNTLGTYNYALGDIDTGAKVMTAQALLAQKMASAGVKIINKDGQRILVRNDGTEYYDDKHNKIDLKGFIEGAISPILKKNEGQQTPNTPTGPTAPAAPGTHKVNTAAIKELETAMQTDKVE